MFRLERVNRFIRIWDEFIIRSLHGRRSIPAEKFPLTGWDSRMTARASVTVLMTHSLLGSLADRSHGDFHGKRRTFCEKNCPLILHSEGGRFSLSAWRCPATNSLNN